MPCFSAEPSTLDVYELIRIRVDGAVEGTRKIQRVGNLYTFLSDIYGEIIVERDYIIIDGAGYTLQGLGAEVSRGIAWAERIKGINVSYRRGVVIKNLEVRGFNIGILLYRSLNCTILGNNIKENKEGILLLYSNCNLILENNVSDNIVRGIFVEISHGNILSRNKIANNNVGIRFYLVNHSVIFGNYIANNGGKGVELRGFNNSVYKNRIIGNGVGVEICFEQSLGNRVHNNSITNNNKGIQIMWGSTSNHIYFNNIADNSVGVYIYDASNNHIHHNNFINNTAEAPDVKPFPPWVPEEPKPPGFNTWDDGREGNYWSDYGLKYPEARKLMGRGVWDTPYFISKNNQDNYPLINPLSIQWLPRGDEHPELPSQLELPMPSEYALGNPLVAMPREYINCAICLIGSETWARVEGVYVMRKIFGAGERFHVNSHEYLVLSDELSMAYPMPPKSRNISIKIDGLTISWSNYTEINPQALYLTALGKWPMIRFKIDKTPNNFTLRVYYEYPLSKVNGSYIFLYALNVSPYLTPWSPNSTAILTIRMETPYEDLGVYLVSPTGIWHPLNYTIMDESGVKSIRLQLVSEYPNPIQGDIVIKFTTMTQQNWLWIIVVITVIAITTALAYMLKQRFGKLEG
ncbi:MAG: NosD domain-containing protein [Candidatus Bathyarchaeia archaeon]